MRVFSVARVRAMLISILAILGIVTLVQIRIEPVEELINEERIRNNIAPLVHDDVLCNLARVRAREITSNWSHEGFKNKSSEFMRLNGYSKLGENLSKNFTINQNLITAWTNSPLHKENIMNRSFTTQCVVCEGTYCASIFGN